MKNIGFWYVRELQRLLGYKPERRLSQNIYERGLDDTGFVRIRSKGDKALFGWHST